MFQHLFAAALVLLSLAPVRAGEEPRNIVDDKTRESTIRQLIETHGEAQATRIPPEVGARSASLRSS